jgi:hypothetical protein
MADLLLDIENGTIRALDLMVLCDLYAEMQRARAKHGTESMDGSTTTDLKRLAALGEETGEVMELFAYDKADLGAELYKELIQTANVAVTWATVVPHG